LVISVEIDDLDDMLSLHALLYSMPLIVLLILANRRTCVITGGSNLLSS